MTTPYDDETLMAFADGELDDAASAELAAAIAGDAALARRVELFRQTRRAAREGLEALSDAPVPDALRANIERLVAAHDAGARQADVVSLDQRRDAGTDSPPPAARKVAAGFWPMAAAASVALVAGGVIGYLAAPGSGGDGAGIRLVQLDRPDVLAALESVASGDERALPDGGSFRAIASFRNQDDTFCREFEIDAADRSTTVAVACRDEAVWGVRFTVSAGSNAEGYAPASSMEALDAYLDASGAGEPLSVDEETQALEALR